MNKPLAFLTFSLLTVSVSAIAQAPQSTVTQCAQKLMQIQTPIMDNQGRSQLVQQFPNAYQEILRLLKSENPEHADFVFNLCYDNGIPLEETDVDKITQRTERT